MIIPIRVDFYDLRDTQGTIYGIFSGFRHVHVGLMIGDMYLLPSRHEPTEWKHVDVVNKVMSKYDRISYDLMTDMDFYLAMMSGMNHTLSSKTWCTVTELPCYLKDIGFRLPSIERTTCATIVSAVLRAANVPVHATTARHLHEELGIAGRFSGTDPLVTIQLQASDELQGR